MYGYVDESGNTGLDVFSSQNVFYLGALISDSDLDIATHSCISFHQARLGVSKLHAVNMDFTDMEPILNDILDIFKSINVEMYFSSIDKLYYVSCQFYDIFFDSHDNDNVDPQEYYDSLFKHSVILELDSLLTMDEKRQFWEALKSPRTRIATFEQITKALAARCASPTNSLRQIMHFAMSFASANAKAFDYEKCNKKLNSPNAIAFSSFLHRYHHIANTNNWVPNAIIVDREDQFRSIFQFCRDALENIYMVPQEEAELPSLPIESKYSLPLLSVVDSSSSSALQALDVLLYVLRSQHTALKSVIETALSDKIHEFIISKEISTYICALRIKAMQ